jgi:hypothetical protein
MSEPARQLASATEPATPAQLELVEAPSKPAAPREPEQLPLLRMLEIVRNRVELIHEELRDIKVSLPIQRRPLSRRTQQLHITATLSRRGGFCSCCQETPVVDANGRLPGAEFDHWYGRHQNRVTQTWLVCSACNARLNDSNFKAAARSAFESYQQALKPLLSRQVTMELREEKGRSEK